MVKSTKSTHQLRIQNTTEGQDVVANLFLAMIATIIYILAYLIGNVELNVESGLLLAGSAVLVVELLSQWSKKTLPITNIFVLVLLLIGSLWMITSGIVDVRKNIWGY